MVTTLLLIFFQNYIQRDNWGVVQPNRRHLEGLDRYIGDSYEDKLEGRIEPDFWQTKTGQRKKEQIDILAQVESLNRANSTYLQEGVRLMELALRAHELFVKTMTPSEKREIVSLVLSNPRIEDGKPRFVYKMPFAMMVNSTKTEKWLARLDSNQRPIG